MVSAFCYFPFHFQFSYIIIAASFICFPSVSIVGGAAISLHFLYFVSRSGASLCRCIALDIELYVDTYYRAQKRTKKKRKIFNSFNVEHIHSVHIDAITEIEYDKLADNNYQ